jgi:hypothetical protein
MEGAAGACVVGETDTPTPATDVAERPAVTSTPGAPAFSATPTTPSSTLTVAAAVETDTEKVVPFTVATR